MYKRQTASSLPLSRFTSLLLPHCSWGLRGLGVFFFFYPRLSLLSLLALGTDVAHSNSKPIVSGLSYGSTDMRYHRQTNFSPPLHASSTRSRCVQHSGIETTNKNKQRQLHHTSSALDFFFFFLNLGSATAEFASRGLLLFVGKETARTCI